MAAENVRSGLIEVVQWHETADADPDQTMILDVRSEAERRLGTIPGSMHIPLPQLRARLDELPRDREIIVHCQTGQRSYNACRLLIQHGFRARNLVGSYRTWKVASEAVNRSTPVLSPRHASSRPRMVLERTPSHSR